MPSTGSEVILDFENAATCRHCGQMLPMRKIHLPFGKTTHVGIGHVPCECEGAKRERAARERREREIVEAKRAASRSRLLEKAGVPPRYRDAEHPWARKMADMAVKGQGFYIHGPNGTGKTTLAMAVAILLVERRVKVCALSTYDLMDAMRSRKDEDRALFERACVCDVLVLDDLGKEATNTAYACERLFAIIDKRDKAALPVIVTSNFNNDEVARRITEGAAGRAIASRLGGSCKGVELTGEDRRLSHG